MTFSDEHITAYLDGELEAGQNAAFEALRAASPDFARRVAALELDIEAVQAGFAPLLAEAPVFAASERAPRRTWVWGSAVAAVAVLAVGLAYGPLAPPRAAPWQMEVAHYQALYVPETISVITPDPARLQGELARAEGLLGLKLDQAALSNVPGLTLLRAQVLGFEGRNLIQIVYATEAGIPVAFCILGGEAGGVSETKLIRLLGMDTALWQGAERGFMIIGGQDSALIAESARYLREVL